MRRCRPVLLVLSALALLLAVAPTAAATGSSGRGASAASPWPQHLVVADGFADTPVVEAGGTTAFGIVPAFPDQTVYGRLEGVNLLTGKTSRGPLVFEVQTQLVRVGSFLGLLEPTAESVAPNGFAAYALSSSNWTLHRVEAAPARLAVGNDLRAVGRTAVGPLTAVAADASAGGPRVYHRGRLLLFDPATASVRRSIPAPAGPVNAIVVAPSGAMLYVSTENQSATTTPVHLFEVDAATGKVLARRGLAAGLPFGSVEQATASGVWMGESRGMSTHFVALFSASGLEPAAASGAGSASPTPSPGDLAIDGYGATLLGGTVWIESATMLTCASAATGAVEAATPLGSTKGGGDEPVTPFAVHRHTLYVLGDPFSGRSSGAVLDLSAPAACFAQTR